MKKSYKRKKGGGGFLSFFLLQNEPAFFFETFVIDDFWTFGESSSIGQRFRRRSIQDDKKQRLSKRLFLYILIVVCVL